MPPPEDVRLSETLKFFPFPMGDPVPWWIREFLDKEQLLGLARLQLQLVRDIATVHAQVAESAQKILEGGVGR